MSAPSVSGPRLPDSQFTNAHLTAEQIDHFDEFGYVVLRDRIPALLLERLQSAADAWIARGRVAAEHGDDARDYQFAQRATGPVMWRVDYLHNKGQEASLELLGSPAVLGIAESLAGPNLVPTYESLVFKDEGDGAAVAWHQDAVHPRTARIFNIDVYLDHSRIGEGALRVAPGSHRREVDVCELTDVYGWNAPGVVHVEMGPGDVLVHDVMVVHGSEAVTGNRLRRTIYYEFRPAEQIMAEGPWDAAWIDQRMRLLPIALAQHARMNPHEIGFRWNPDSEFRPESGPDAEAELRIAHLVHTPGSYCSAGSVPLAH